MNLDEAQQILNDAGYLVEDFEEDVARKLQNGNLMILSWK